MTNFEQIKAMSVEEMEEFLGFILAHGWVCGATDIEYDQYDKEWLESEVEEE